MRYNIIYLYHVLANSLDNNRDVSYKYVLYTLYISVRSERPVCRIPKVVFLSFHTLYYIQIVKCLLNEKVVSVCVYLFFFGVYLYFCNIFFSLSHENVNVNVYLVFAFFFTRSYIFLHTDDIPTHIQLTFTRDFAHRHSYPFAFAPFRPSHANVFVSSQSISRSQDT